MTDILSRIDASLDGRCPCGADPRPGSAYCSWDCEPTHLARDTDTRQSGHYATPMRWRPDLVAAVDDSDLIPVDAPYAAETVAIAEGRHNAHVYRRASDPTVWHLRLDDGHRYVGCDLAGMGGRKDPITVEQTARIHDTWQRLERELGNSRHLEPDDDPWADVMLYPSRWQPLPGYTIRRRCPHCNQHVTTRHGMRAVIDTRPASLLATLADIREHATNLEPCDLCGNCRRPFPGPPVYVTLQRDHWTHTIRVRLKADGFGPVETVLTLLHEEDLGDLGDRIQNAVDVLEDRLFETLSTRAEPDYSTALPEGAGLAMWQWRALADIEGRIMDPRALFRVTGT